MNQVLHDSYTILIDAVSKLDGVLAVGKSGGAALPTRGESDIDLYIICTQVPSTTERRQAVETLGNVVTSADYHEHSTRFWGVIDFLDVADTEICLMYYTAEYMNDEIESILNGSRPEKEAGHFYPTGRCATLLSLYPLFDPSGYIASVQEQLSVYPQVLADKLFTYHIQKADVLESFKSALVRQDVLYYHERVEKVIDHFLQALFALNKRYFPSRKRMAQHIETFALKPENCVERLLQIIELGAKSETLSQSSDVWDALYKELCALKGD